MSFSILDPSRSLGKIKGEFDRAGAERQVKDFPEFFWASYPFDGSYEKTRSYAEALLNARKAMRNFASVSWGSSSPKCSLDGCRESVIPARGLEFTHDACCVIPDNGCAIALHNQVILEDLDLAAEASGHAREWAEWISQRVFLGDQDWQRVLTGRFCIVHDDVMGFLLDTATEVTARVRLREEAKTVEKGGLWYEEVLPTETILSGLVVATPIMATVDKVFTVLASLMGEPLQLGGKATVGRGLCRLRLETGRVAGSDR